MAVMLAAVAVAGFFALRLLLGYVGLLRLLVRSETPPPEVRGLFETMAAGTRWVRLLVSRRLLVPLSCGLLRPTVVLPATMCQQPTPRQLRWIFAHELTHLRRRDAWSALLFNFGQVFFFAVPWFWWLRRQVRLCQEYVADAAAAEQDEGNVEYAEFLVSLANAPAVPVGASAVSGNCSDLFRRVAMLLKNPMRVETRCPRLWNFMLAISLAGLAILVSGFGYRAEAAEDDTIIIIINSQGPAAKGQPEKPHEIRIIVDGKEDGKFTAKATGVYKADPAKKVVEATRTLIIKTGDKLAPLQEAVKRLETAKKDGKLTNELLYWELARALQLMQSPAVAPPVIPPTKAKKDDTPNYRIVEKKVEIQLDPKAIEKKLEIRVDPKAKSAPKADSDNINKLLERLQAGGLVEIQPWQKMDKLDIKMEVHDATEKDLRELKKVVEQLQKLLDGKEQSKLDVPLRLPAQPRPPAAPVPPAAPDQPPPPKPSAALAAVGVTTSPSTSITLTRPAVSTTTTVTPMSSTTTGMPASSTTTGTAKSTTTTSPKAIDAAPRKQNKDGQSLFSIQLRVGVEPIRANMAEHLKLPNDIGMTVIHVDAGSPAAKAGIKFNDILVKIDGQYVPANLEGFIKLVKGLKTETPIDVIVLRQGTSTTIAGVILPAERAKSAELAELERIVTEMKKVIAPRKLLKDLTITQNGDITTVKDEKRETKLTISCVVKDGVVYVGGVEVNDGSSTKAYKNILDVPEPHRARVQEIVNALPALRATGEKK